MRDLDAALLLQNERAEENSISTSHSLLCFPVGTRRPGYTKRLKTQRGNVSLLFLGKDSPAPGTLMKLDHGKKKVGVFYCWWWW